jgi:hypothetical protein
MAAYQPPVKTLDAAIDQNSVPTREATDLVPPGHVTEEQRSRRAIFGETFRAEDRLPLDFVPPPKIAAELPRRRSVSKAGIPLSGVTAVFYGLPSQRLNRCHPCWGRRLGAGCFPYKGANVCACLTIARKSFLLASLIAD